MNNENIKNLMKLEVWNLKKIIDKKEILKDVSFECTIGEKVAILGPNGAGKTTTLMTVSGFYKPDGGKIIIKENHQKEKDITELSVSEKAKMGIVYLPQKNSLFDELSVYENFQISCEISGIPKEKTQEVSEKFELQKILHRKVGVLSGGERRKAEIARINLLSPRFLILDEPFAGIDPKSINLIVDIIEEMSKNSGIIISDHNVRDVLKICSRAYLIYDGKTLDQGTPQEIASSYKAKSVFFGENFEL